MITVVSTLQGVWDKPDIKPKTLHVASVLAALLNSWSDDSACAFNQVFLPDFDVVRAFTTPSCSEPFSFFHAVGLENIALFPVLRDKFNSDRMVLFLLQNGR